MADNRLVPISDQLIYNGVGPVDAKNIPVETVDNLPSDLVAYEGLRVYVKSECADFLYTKVNGELTWVKQTNGGEDIAPLSGSVVTLSASTVNIQNDVKNVSGDVITLADSLDELSASTVTIENNVTNLSASTVVVENNLAELSASTVVVESGLTELSATTVDIEERLKELENAGLIRINIFDYLSDESIVESAQTANFYTTVYQFSGDTAKEIVNLDDYNNILSTFVKKGAFISNEANQFYDIASIMPTSDGNAGVESAVQLAFQMESIRIKPATESFIPVSLHGFIQITHYDNDNVIVSAAITSTDTPIVYALANLYEYAIGNVNTDEYLAGEIADNELNLSGNVVMVKDITESDYDVTNGEVEKQTWVFVYSDEGQSETFTYSAINYGTENGYYRWLFISEEGDKDYIYLDKMYAVNEVIPYYFYKEDDGSFERSDFGEEETLTVADEVYGEDITIPNKKALADVYDVKNEIGFKNIVKSFTATYENTSIVNLERNTEEDVNEYYGWTASICGSTDTMIIYTQTLSISDGDTITLYADDGAGSYQSADYAVSNVVYRTTGLYKFVNDKIINSKDSRYITIDKNPEVLSINAKTSYIDGINLSDVENIRITAHALGLYTLWERHTDKDEQGYYAWKVINSDESDGCVYTKEIPSLGDSINLYQKNDDGEFISEGVLGTVEVLGLNSTYLSLDNNYTFDDPSVTIDNLPYHKGMKAFYCDNSEKNEDGYYRWVGCLLTDFNPVTVAYGEFYSTELPSSVSQEIDIYSKDESGYTDTLINAVVKEFKLSSPYSIDTDGLAMTADVKKHLKNLADKMGEISGKTCTVYASGDTFVGVDVEGGNAIHVSANTMTVENAYAAHDLNTTEVWDNNGTEVTLTYAGGDKARESYIKYDGSDGKTYLKYKVIPNRLLVYNEDEGRYEWSDYTFVSAESTHYNEVNGLTTALDVQKEISAITVESKNQYILTSLTGTSLTGLTAVVKMIDEAVESGYTITSFIAQNSRGILNPDGDVTECYPESDLDELPYYAYKTMLGDVFYTKKTPIQIAKGVSAEFFKKENDEFVSVGTVTIGDVDKHYISATFAMADVLDVKRHLTALADENDDLRKRVAKLEEQMAAVLNNITVNPEQ